MNKQSIAKFMNNVSSTMSKHSPEILTGIGIAGMITTTILAVKATPKALELINEERYYRDQNEEEDISKLDAVKLCWKCYIPSAVTGVVSVACLIGASRVSLKRNAALATAYKLSETALTEYREKVIETIGEKKEQNVKDQVAKDRIEQNPVSKNEVIVSEKGNTLCYDVISGRYFKSDIEKIKRAENDLNKEILHSMCGYASLNDFYEEIGLPSTSLGDELGWNTSSLLDIDFSSQIADDGTPCIVVNYEVAPRYGYDKYM
jgi:hypothetical protein